MHVELKLKVRIGSVDSLVCVLCGVTAKWLRLPCGLWLRAVTLPEIEADCASVHLPEWVTEASQFTPIQPVLVELDEEDSSNGWPVLQQIQLAWVPLHSHACAVIENRVWTNEQMQVLKCNDAKEIFDAGIRRQLRGHRIEAGARLPVFWNGKIRTMKAISCFPTRGVIGSCTSIECILERKLGRPMNVQIPVALASCIESFISTSRISNEGASPEVRHRPLLMIGRRGIGKTTIARSIESANQGEVNVVLVNGQEFVGVDIDHLLIQARSTNNMQIVVIDDLDRIISMGSPEEHKGHVFSLIEATKQCSCLVIGIVAAAELVDPRFLEAGRFERLIEVLSPNSADRKRIFKTVLYDLRTEISLPESDLDFLAQSTPGLIAGDIVRLVRDTLLNELMLSRHSILLTLSTGRKHVSGDTIGRQVTAVQWTSIGGYEAQKKRLQMITAQWATITESPSMSPRLSIPSGVLLHGPTACGKTLMVAAMASNLSLNFISASINDIVSAYLGESESRVRMIFRQAEKRTPCVLFFDEIDCLGASRSCGADDAGGVQKRVLSTLLNEMDGLERRQGVYIVAASNRPELLDSALVRPGRLDHILEVPLPTQSDRTQILAIHARDMALSPCVDFESIASKCEGRTCAFLRQLCQEAGLEALRKDREASSVDAQDFDLALMELGA